MVHSWVSRYHSTGTLFCRHTITMTADRERGIPPKVITWTSVAPPRGPEILPTKPRALSEEARAAASPVELWQLFFTEEMLELLVRYTNERIAEDIQENLFRYTEENLKKAPHLKPVGMVSVQYAVCISKIINSAHQAEIRNELFWIRLQICWAPDTEIIKNTWCRYCIINKKNPPTTGICHFLCLTEKSNFSNIFKGSAGTYCTTIQNPQAKNKKYNFLFICSFILAKSGSETKNYRYLIGECSKSDRIRINNTDFSLKPCLYGTSTVRYLLPFFQLELKALIGLIYMRGLIGATRILGRELWSGNYSPVFIAAMSNNRFSYLLSMLRLDDIAVRDEAERYRYL